jgi:threonine aldolase
VCTRSTITSSAGERSREGADLAEAIVVAGVPVALEQVETNFVQIDLAPLGLDRSQAFALLRDAGVGLSSTIHPTVIRAVTHLEITDEEIERAAELIPAALVRSRG